MPGVPESVAVPVGVLSPFKSGAKVTPFGNISPESMLRPGAGAPVVVKEKFPNVPTTKVVFGSLVNVGAVWAIAATLVTQIMIALAVLCSERNTSVIGLNDLQHIIPAAEIEARNEIE